MCFDKRCLDRIRVVDIGMDEPREVVTSCRTVLLRGLNGSQSEAGQT